MHKNKIADATLFLCKRLEIGIVEIGELADFNDLKVGSSRLPITKKAVKDKFLDHIKNSCFERGSNCFFCDKM